MKTIEITAATRSGSGKTAAKDIRNAGKVPCVIYGNGDPVHFSADYLSLERALYSPETFLVKLTVDGTAMDAVIREAQFHPVTDRILHVDFYRVVSERPVVVELPIRLTGTAAGVVKGGILQPLMRKLKVSGLISSLPEQVTIDVTPLELGKTIKVESLNIEGLTIVSPAAAGVATVLVPRSAKTEEATAVTTTAAAPTAAPAAAPAAKKETKK